MNGMESLRLIIEEMDEIRELILVSGFYSIQENSVLKIKDIAGNANRCGLEQGGQLLGKIAERLETKRHVLDYDFKELINDFFALNVYVEAVKKKLEIVGIQEAFGDDNVR